MLIYLCRGPDIIVDGIPDNVGKGVVRQVLEKALEICREKCLMAHFQKDEYEVLTPQRLVIPSRREACYALGFLCMAYFVKVENGPDPVSPMLLQVVLGGLESLLEDMSWLRKIVPDSVRLMELMPIEAGEGEFPVDDTPERMQLVLAIENYLVSVSFLT